MDQPKVYMKLILKGTSESNIEITINHIDCSYYSKQIITDKNAVIYLYHENTKLFEKEFKFQVSERFYGFSTNGKTFYICSQLKKKILFINLSNKEQLPTKLKLRQGIDAIYVNDFLIVQHKENMLKCYTFGGKVLCEYNEKYAFNISSLSCQDNSFLLQEKYSANSVKIMTSKHNKLIKVATIRVSRNIFYSYLQSLNKQSVYLITQCLAFIVIKVYQKITNKLQLIRKFVLKQSKNNLSPFIEKPVNKPYFYLLSSEQNEKVGLLQVDEMYGQIKKCGQLQNIINVEFLESLRIINQNEHEQLNNLKYMAVEQYGIIE